MINNIDPEEIYFLREDIEELVTSRHASIDHLVDKIIKLFMDFLHKENDK